MRILISSETYLPSFSGVVVFTQNLALALKARGHTVAIFAPSINGQYLEEQIDGITVYRFSSLPNPFRAKQRFVVRQYDQVEEAFQRFGPDVCHLQSPTGVPAMVQKAAKRQGVPVVITHHFSFEFIQIYLKPLFFIKRITERALLAYFNHLYRQCAAVTCPTNTIRRDLHKLGIKVPFRVISNGINLQMFKPITKSKLKVDWSIPSLLYVGRIDKDKNVALLLQVLNLVAPQIDCQLLLVGSGNRVKHLRQQAQQMGLASKVHFLGKFPAGSNALLEAYSCSTLFLMPSNIETQSLVTMEAMVAGLPVVGPRAGAIPELIRHNLNGFLANPSDPEDYAHWTLELLKKPAMRTQFALASREIIGQHDFAQTVNQFIDLYKEIIDAKVQA